MRVFLPLILMTSLTVNATSPATPVKAMNTECQSELEELDKQFSNAYNMMIPDIVINLHINSLIKIRKTAISEGSLEVQKQIDAMIAKELIDVINSKEKVLSFSSQLLSIKEYLVSEPLMIESETINKLDSALDTIKG